MRLVKRELLTVILVVTSAWLLSLIVPQRDDGVLMSFWQMLAGLGGSLLGGLLGNRKSREEKDALAAQAQLQRTQAGALESGVNAANAVLPQGRSFLDLFQSTLNPVTSYFSRLLSGDRGAMMETLGPEIASTGEAYDQARRTAATSMPRGGLRSSTTGDLLADKTRTISNLFSAVRPMAAQNLMQIAPIYGNVGQGLTGQGLFALTNAGFGAGQTGANLLNYGQQNREMAFNIGSQTGRGLFDIFRQLQNRNRTVGGPPAGAGITNPARVAGLIP